MEVGRLPRSIHQVHPMYPIKISVEGGHTPRPRILLCRGPSGDAISSARARRTRQCGGSAMRNIDRSNEPKGIERPLPSDGTGTWGSDAIAELLRALDIPY